MATRTRSSRGKDLFETRLASRLSTTFKLTKPYGMGMKKVVTNNERIYTQEKAVDSDSDDDVVFLGAQPGEKSRPISIDSSSDSGSDTEDCIEVEVEVPKLVGKQASPAQDSPASKAFKGLPIEIHQHIASFFDDDNDVCSYALICRKAGSSITSSVWRKRFDAIYDMVDGLSVKELHEKYAYRRDVSKKWTCFDLGKFGGQIDPECRKFQKENQENCLKMLRNLLLESNAIKTVGGDGNITTWGKNFQFIHELLTGGNSRSHLDIIDSIFSTDNDKEMNKLRDMNRIVSASMGDTLVYAVQLCLTPLSLHPTYCQTKASHFDISQYEAYDTAGRQPIFVGKYKQDINVRWLLHVVNFFKYHLTAVDEGLLAHEYGHLDSDQFPQVWEGRVRAGTQPLGSHWKGAYTYMDPETQLSLRMWNGSSSCIHTDSLDGDETFQDMSLFFDEKEYPTHMWPKFWEDVLCSDPFSEITAQGSKRASARNKSKEINKPKIKQFWGSCRGAKNGHFFGRIHAMTPQQGIHGFQRLTMMKYYTREENNSQVYDPEQVWAYEGCVLPGGQIIVGRWWDPRGDKNDIRTVSGPFLWWNVNRSDADVTIKGEEGLEFLDSAAGTGLDFF